MALIGQGRNQEAIDVMAPIRQTSPIFTEAVLQLTSLYEQTGQLDAAIAALRKLLKINQQQPDIYYYLTAFLDEAGKTEEAAEEVATALEKFPKEASLRYQQGLLFEKLGERERALQAMEQVLEVNPNHPDALNFIAYYHAERGTQLELALSQAQKALSVKKSGYIIDTLGWVYFKLGRYQESRKQLEAASALTPEDPVILEHLGDLYRAMELWGQAAETYRKVLSLDPDAAGVAEKLEQLPQVQNP